MNARTWQQWTAQAGGVVIYLALILAVSYVSLILSVLGLYGLELIQNWDFEDIRLLLATIPMALNMVGFITIVEFSRRVANPKTHPWPLHMIEKKWLRRTVQLTGFVICPAVSLGTLFVSWVISTSGLYLWSMIREWELDTDLCVLLALLPAALTMVGFIAVCKFSWKTGCRMWSVRKTGLNIDHDRHPS